MRVYVPATSTVLRDLLARDVLDAVPLTAFAVTPALREWYVDDDGESLEYAALSEAARASLRLVDADAAAARRRVVLAVDAPDSTVEVRDDLDRGVVRVTEPISLAAIASVHIDDAEAEATVAIAAEAMIAAELGSTAAQDLVDDAEGYELSWYANQEIDHVLGSL
jgi:hypothetical protein